MTRPLPAISDPVFCALTVHCKATADQQRLQILRVLAQDSFSVLELCHILDMNQPALSHHLKILAEASLVETRRQGTSIFYRRALVTPQSPLAELQSTLFDTLDAVALDPLQEKRKLDIHGQRHEQARQFFEKHADRFQENQDLIAEYTHYAECMTGLLDSEPDSTRKVAIEVGPGESDLILTLAERYEAVIAVDNAGEMLARTRAKIDQAGASGVTFLSGQLEDVPHQADLIVLNMVLHHLASPAALFRTARQKLAPGGRLLIADLGAHDQDWTRKACGDLWQGFEADELKEWATDAGLTVGQSSYLGLKNGFQVQVHLFNQV